MNAESIGLIRTSFAKILFKKDTVGRIFYDRLFEIAPEVRPLFTIDMDAQARKLMDTLAVAVNAMRDMPLLKQTLTDLGRRHRGYGVQPGHYGKVGEALLWTLEKELGPAFDAPTRAAWTELFGFVASQMEPHLA